MIDLSQYSPSARTSLGREESLIAMRKKDSQGEELILKEFDPKQTSFRTFERICRAIDIFADSNLPYSNRIVGVATKSFDGSPSIGVVVPLLKATQLYEIIHTHKKDISPTLKSKIAYSIAYLLDALHSSNSTFPMLESKSIWISDEGDITFDCSSIDSHPELFSFYPWLAPEFDEGKESPSNDIFALGVILHELLTGTLPLSDSSDRNELIRQYKQGQRPELPSSPIADLIGLCLSKSERPSAEYVKSQFATGKSLFDGTNKAEFDAYAAITPPCNVAKSFTKLLSGCSDGPSQFLLSIYLSDSDPAASRKALEKSAAGKFAPAMFSLSEEIEASDSQLSLKYLKESASLGFVPAISKLGEVFLKAKKLQAAAQLFKEAADLGDIIASTNYGQMVLIGAGVKQSQAEAEKYLKKAAEFGDSNAQFLLGSLYLENGNQDGFRLLVASGAQGNENAQLATAFELSDEKSPNFCPKEAITLLKKIADRTGNLDAILKAAFLLKSENPPESVGLFKLASEKGSTIGLIEYAKCLCNSGEFDRGVDMLRKSESPDAKRELAIILGATDEANRLMHEAAESGDSTAMFLIGSDPNGKDSVEMMRRAAKMHNPQAMDAYASMIDSGRAAGSSDEALHLLKASAEMGCNAGLLHYGMKVGDLESIKKASMNGYIPAVTTLGLMLCEGRMVEKSQVDGLKLLEAAAADGYIPAIFYLSEEVKTKDPERAKDLLKKAADGHFPLAVEALKNSK